jgi:hypothetical protein
VCVCWLVGGARVCVLCEGVCAVCACVLGDTACVASA